MATVVQIFANAFLQWKKIISIEILVNTVLKPLTGDKWSFSQVIDTGVGVGVLHLGIL